MSRSTWTRIGSALVAAALLFPSAWAGGAWWALLAFGVMAVALYEFHAMCLPGHPRARVMGVVTGLGVAGGITTGLAATEAGLLFWVGTVVVPALWFLLDAGPLETAAHRIGLTVLGILWVGALGGLASSVVFLDEGFAWLVLAAGMAFGSDIGAFFVGRSLGRTPLYPRISPNKTVEGSVGGIVMATIFAFGFRALIGPGIPTVHLMLIAPMGAIFGQLGDLAQSLLKRSVGVKDSGSIMPGHGGLFDRIDAMLFIGPALFLYGRFVLGTEVVWLELP